MNKFSTSKFAGTVVGLLSILVVAVSFSGAAIAGPQGKRIALLTGPNQQPYIGAWASTFMKHAKAYGMKTTQFVSHFDPALQSQQVGDAVAQKFDLILLNTLNHRAIIPALVRAKAAGVPVILVVDPGDPHHTDLWVSYIGVDQVRLGRLAGENLVKGLALEGKTKAQVAAVTGKATQLNAILRMKGFNEVLAKHPGIKLVDVQDGRWNTALTEKETGDMLVRYSARGGLQGIFGMSDNQATGVIQAVESAGLKVGVKHKGIVVVGSNCMKEGIMHIKEGKQFGTNTQIPTVEARAAAKLVAAYFNGKKLTKEELVPSYSVTRVNVGRFAQACSY